MLVNINHADSYDFHFHGALFCEAELMRTEIEVTAAKYLMIQNINILKSQTKQQYFVNTQAQKNS